MTALLEVSGLRTSFRLDGGGEFDAVEGISFSVDPGRTLLVDVNTTNNSRTLEPEAGSQAPTTQPLIAAAL